jgi:hypothetical protein
MNMLLPHERRFQGGFPGKIALIGEKVTNFNFGRSVEIPVESQRNSACHSSRKNSAKIDEQSGGATSLAFASTYSDVLRWSPNGPFRG